MESKTLKEELLLFIEAVNETYLKFKNREYVKNRKKAPIYNYIEVF